MSPHLAASIRARLLGIAKAQGSDFTQALVCFSLDRILYPGEFDLPVFTERLARAAPAGLSDLQCHVGVIGLP